MSIIFGMFYRDGRLVTHELEAMYSGMQHFHHERYALCKKAENCGLGIMLNYNTPEALNEVMPKWIEGAKLMFVAEGRVDNREELFTELKIHPSEQASIPDGDLILSAYLKWGETCIDKLLGKFSLAAFHQKEQRLFLARDKWDTTSIDYYEDDKVFAFASSVKGLLPLPCVKTEIDEEIIALAIAEARMDYDKTNFKNIKTLLPSHAISVTNNKSSLVRYWNQADIPIRHGLKLEDYTEELFDNLDKAVAARLRSYKPVASMLSGGMDSTTVSHIAANHYKNRGTRLTTYTHFPQFAPPQSLNHCIGDERELAQTLVSYNGNIDPIFLNSSHISPITGVRKRAQAIDEILRGSANSFWVMDITEEAQKSGFGVLLCGAAGNMTISQNGKGKLNIGLSSSNLLSNWLFVKRRVIKPILSINQKNIYNTERLLDEYYASSDLILKYNLKDRIDSHSKHRRRILNGGHNPFTTESLVYLKDSCLRAKMGYESGVEKYDPCADIRVWESALSIPPKLFFGKMNKWVFRNMMRNKLPDKIRLNTKKGKQSSDLARRLVHNKTEMDDLLSDLDKSNFAWMLKTNKLHSEWNNIVKAPESYPIRSLAIFMRAISTYASYQELVATTKRYRN